MSAPDYAPARRPLLLALDLGATKTCALAGVSRGDEIAIVGHGLAPSAGLRGGAVVDLEETAHRIGEAARAACQAAGRSADSLWLGLTGAHFQCARSQGEVHVAGEVRQSDVDRALEIAAAAEPPRGREVLHVIPRWYEVDAADRVARPVGLAASRLAAQVSLVTASSNVLDNAEKAVGAAGLKVEEIVMAPIATALSALGQEHRRMGVLLLDIGAATTDFALFADGALARCGCVPMAGEHLTRDLAAGLRVPPDAAEELKVSYGRALADKVDPREMVHIPGAPLRSRRPVLRRLIASVLEARLREILSLAAQALEEPRWQLMAPGGVVLTGGTSQLPGIVELAGEALACPATLATCLGTVGPPEVVGSPGHAACVGLLHYAAQRRLDQPHPVASDDGLWTRVGELLRRLLRRP